MAAANVARLIRFTCNMDIELNARIGRRIRIPHPYAIIIGGNSTVGDDCTIMQCVTIGGNFGKARGDQTQPQIGNGVFLGAGAKVLGPVILGDRARVGANSVVLKDVPDDALAVGVPAVVKGS